ncbi:MAG: cell division protein FtsH [Anaerolineae bacterium CG2_30_64_16]|nr:MAG: cell division protein FtsH [Anaerolineae bacterium CG2_30_64_16]
MNPTWQKNGLVYLLLLVAIAALFYSASQSTERPPEKQLTEVAALIQKGKIASITIVGDQLQVKLTNDSQTYLSHKEPDVNLTSTLIDMGVSPEALAAIKLEVAQPTNMGSWLTVLGTLLPLVLIGGLFLMILRQAQGSNNQAISFGKSKARVFTGDKPTVTFEDVAGAEESKHELQEVVEFLKEPQKFASLGARIPKGVLLVGPPGTGKTLMAKAISGEAGVPFFSISGSEFVEMFVGVGASRVRDLFEQAKRNSPCIIFVDEIDAVGRQRGAGLGGSHDEREQTLNQILVEMDGFDTDTNVILIAATNRPDILDPALLRPGRFDRQVVMDRPDMGGREAILKVHVRGKPLEPTVDLNTIAKGTPGFVGADIENLVNEAAILAARRNKRSIGMPEFEEAVERVIAGPERRSRLISTREKEIIAYHEAGHALVRRMLPKCDPVHKISIISRGMALGYTMALPENDRVLVSKAKFQDDLAAMLAGRVAEQTIFDDITNGAVDDLDKVTKTARAMVTQYGMSAKMGPMVFGQRHELVFLGREIGEQRNYGEEVAREIDEEVNRIVTAAYEKAEEILTRHSKLHHAIAHKLIEAETLDADEFEKFFVNVAGAPPRRVEPAPAPVTPAPGRNGGITVPGADRPVGSPTPRPAPA